MIVGGDNIDSKLGLALYVIALLLGIASIVFSYTGLPENYDTEPILGVGILCIALAGIIALSKKE